MELTESKLQRLQKMRITARDKHNQAMGIYGSSEPGSHERQHAMEKLAYWDGQYMALDCAIQLLLNLEFNQFVFEEYYEVILEKNPETGVTGSGKRSD